MMIRSSSLDPESDLDILHDKILISWLESIAILDSEARRLSENLSKYDVRWSGVIKLMDGVQAMICAAVLTTRS